MLSDLSYTILIYFTVATAVLGMSLVWVHMLVDVIDLIKKMFKRKK